MDSNLSPPHTSSMCEGWKEQRAADSQVPVGSWENLSSRQGLGHQVFVQARTFVWERHGEKPLFLV